MKRDIEVVFYDLFDFVKNNLNTYINNINVEKGDTLLENIDASSFFEFPFENQANIINRGTFVVFGLTGSTPISTIGATSSDLEFTMAVYMTKNINLSNTDIVKRLFRYSRAIRETIQKAAQKVGLPNLLVQEIPPFAEFDYSEGNSLMRGSGVQITLTYVD